MSWLALVAWPVSSIPLESTVRLVSQASAGSLEEQFLRGAQREALMTGASVNEAAKPEDLTQVRTEDGYEFWDKSGVAYRLKDGSMIYVPESRPEGK